MGVLKLDDIGPDGVRMVVDWDRVAVGSSVFIPCVDVGTAHKQVRAIFARRDWGLRATVSVEKHILGLRVWRTT
jgi:hypothetical protein